MKRASFRNLTILCNRQIEYRSLTGLLPSKGVVRGIDASEEVESLPLLSLLWGGSRACLVQSTFKWDNINAVVLELGGWWGIDTAAG